MQDSDLLRVSLLLSSDSKSNIQKSIVNLVRIVLYDATKKDLSPYEIQQEIQKKFEIEFTEEEIVEAIRKKDSGIEIIDDTNTKTYKKVSTISKNMLFKLSDTLMQEMSIREHDDIFERILLQFTEAHKEYNIVYEDLKVLITRFIYSLFNSNKASVLSLFDKDSAKVTEELEDGTFTNEEKLVINLFTKWSNIEKDKFIFETIAYSIDFCMLTVRKNNSLLTNIFKGKVFYLDANVVFRLAGINNQERKLVLESFIQKCIENGITFKYTNFTKKEISNTIRAQTKWLKRFSQGNEIVNIEHFRELAYQNTNFDLLSVYDEWRLSNKQNSLDFDSFSKFLQEKIRNILSQFERDEFTDFKVTKPREYSSYYDSLFDYKKEKLRYPKSSSVHIDVNNFLHILELRNKKYSHDFMSTKEYIISTDGHYCTWTSNIIPESIPVAIKPSVWHSMLLKFVGRTSDDYKSFSLFLNMRYRVRESSNDIRKPNILYKIQGLKEDLELKNKLLSEIEDNLLIKYDFDDVDLIIETAKENIVAKEISKVQPRFHEKGVQEGKEIGKKEAQDEFIEKVAVSNANNEYNQKVKKRNIINWGLTIASIILIITATYNFDYIFNLKHGENKVTDIIGTYGYVISLPFGFLTKKISGKYFKDPDYDEILEKHRGKITDSIA